MCRTILNFAIILSIIFAVFSVNDLFSAELPVTFLFGHKEQVLSTAFSPVKPILASAGGEEIILWDTQTMEQIAELPHEHSARVISLDFSPQGLLASSAEDETIIIWDIEKLQPIHKIIGHNGAVSSIEFSPDGHLIASGGNDRVIKIWDVDTGEELAALHGHKDAVFDVAFSPNGDLLASGSGDGTIILWDLYTYQQVSVFAEHKGFVWTLDFSPDGSQIVSGSWDGTVRLWDIENPEKSILLSDFNTLVLSVSYSPNGEILAIGLLNHESENTIRIWHLESKKEIRSFETKSVHCLSFSPDKQGLVVSGSSDGMIKIWNSDIDNRPVLMSPESDTLIQTPYVNLMWYETVGTVYYEVEIAKDENFTDIIQSATPTAYENFEFELGSESRYWWHVRSCGFGEIGDWSPHLSFRTHPELPEQAVVKVVPANTQVYENKEIEVNVEIENAKNLVGFQIDFAYNSKFIELIELTNTGSIFDSYNVEVIEHSDINKQEKRVSIIVVDDDTLETADSVQGILFTGRFKAKAPGFTNLKLQNIVLVDSEQNKIKYEVVWGSVTIYEVVYPYDINEDGEVNILDLVLVRTSMGKEINSIVSPNPDVNRDGIVDEKDFELVVEHYGEKYYMPPDPPEFNPPPPPPLAPQNQISQDWLGQNFPNPFNPETWIPYRLSQDSPVIIYIFDFQGRKIRTLKIGYKLAGKYINRSSAAYWDGKNELGEPVPSGVYFYSINTNYFSETKKMTICK